MYLTEHDGIDIAILGTLITAAKKIHFLPAVIALTMNHNESHYLN